MAYDPNIRASDTDRDRTASLLREHLAAGRLTPEEFSERLDRAFSARTMGEIDSLLKDLPSIDLYRLPDAELTRRPRQADRGSARRSGHRAAWRAAWGSWFTVVLICFVVWGLTGAGYVWPLWVALPWGAVLAGGWVTTNAFRSGSARRSVEGGPTQGRLPSGDEDLPGRASPLAVLQTLVSWDRHYQARNILAGLLVCTLVMGYGAGFANQAHLK